MQFSTILLLFALLAASLASPLWFDEEEPLNLRAFRVMPNQLETIDTSRRLLKRAGLFNKRRGRELFGKRSMPVEYDDSVMFDNRYRRRANELFG